MNPDYFQLTMIHRCRTHGLGLRKPPALAADTPGEMVFISSALSNEHVLRSEAREELQWKPNRAKIKGNRNPIGETM